MAKRKFRLISRENTFFWFIEQKENSITISQGSPSNKSDEVSQEFDSSDSAILAMDNLIKEKIRLGFIEFDSTEDILPNSTFLTVSRRSAKPELSSSQPTHLRQIKVLTLETPASAYYRTHDSTEFVLFHFESDQGNILSVGLNKLDHDDMNICHKFRFVHQFASFEEAEKVYKKINSFNDVLKFLRDCKLEKTDLSNSKLLTEMCESQLHEVIMSSLKNLSSLSQLKFYTEEKKYDLISENQYQKLIDEVKNSSVNNRPLPKNIFTITSIRHLADRVSLGAVVDNWLEAESGDLSLDVTKVNPEALYLYTLAKSGEKYYGYWVYLKKIIKELEIQGTHLRVLAAFYSKFRDKETFLDSYQKLRIPETFQDSSILVSHFGGWTPSIATQKYMMRRARRYLSSLKNKNIETYSDLALRIISEYDFVKEPRSLESQWIISSIIYSQSWIDLNHGRNIKIPPYEVADNNLQISDLEKDQFLKSNERLIWIFENHKVIEITTFAYQLLKSSGHQVKLEKNRIEHLLETYNYELISEIWDVLEDDFDLFVSVAGFDSYRKYCSKPDAKILGLLSSLLDSEFVLAGRYEAINYVLLHVFNDNPNQVFDYIQSFTSHKNWQVDQLEKSLVASMLIYDSEVTMKLFGSDFFENLFIPIDIWIQSFEKVSSDFINDDLINNLSHLLVRVFGSTLNISQGVHQGSSPGLIELINKIEDSHQFGTLMKLFFAFAANNLDSKMSIAAVMATLIREEDDFLKTLLWASEFDNKDSLLSIKSLSSEIIPWHAAVKDNFKKYVENENFINKVLKLNIPIDFIFTVADTFGSSIFYDEISNNESNKNKIVPLLSNEFLRSSDQNKVNFLLRSEKHLIEMSKFNIETVFDLLTSQAVEIQEMGIRVSQDLNLLDKVWVRMIESQLPIVVEYAKQFVLKKKGKDFTEAVLICLDSAVSSVRDIGISIVSAENARLNMDRIYVALTEHSEPDFAALVAARAMEPGISDQNALDNFDRRQLLSFRTTRRAKELIKERRSAMLQRGESSSLAFHIVLDELSKFGSQQDRDWAIEMLSLDQAVENSYSIPTFINREN